MMLGNVRRRRRSDCDESAYSRQHGVDHRAITQDNIDASTSQQLSSSANLKSAKAQVAIANLVPEQIQQADGSVDESTASVQQAQAQLDQADDPFCGYFATR
jgi:membrane fusion protein, multidrug efflux system